MMMRCINSKFNIAFLLIFAFVQFPIKLAVFPLFTQIYVYGIPLLYLMYRYKWIVTKLRDFFRSTAFLAAGLFLMLIGVSALWPVLLGTWDFSFVTEYWSRFVLVLLKNVFLFCFYECEVSKDRGNIEEYFNYFFGSIILYICFTSLTLASPTIRAIAENVIYLSEADVQNLARSEYFTRFGWSGWSGFDETMRCTFGVLLGCIFAIYAEERKKEIRYFILSCVMAVGTLFYGRTGLVVCLVIFLLTVILAIWKKKHYMLKLFLYIVVLGIVALVILLVAVPACRSWFNWAFSASINLFTTGKFLDNTGSMQHLVEDMYWLPELPTMIFGDARYTNADGSYYMHTDSGIMRHVLFFGVINYILEVFASLIIVWNVLGKFGKHFGINRRERFILMSLVIVTIALFEFKGESFSKLVCLLAPPMLALNKDDSGL